MGKFAMMSGNTVQNIIIADDKEETEKALQCILIEFTDEDSIGIGFLYDEETQKFYIPASEINIEEVG